MLRIPRAPYRLGRESSKVCTLSFVCFLFPNGDFHPLHTLSPLHPSFLGVGVVQWELGGVVARREGLLLHMILIVVGLPFVLCHHGHQVPICWSGNFTPCAFPMHHPKSLTFQPTPPPICHLIHINFQHHDVIFPYRCQNNTYSLVAKGYVSLIFLSIDFRGIAIPGRTSNWAIAKWYRSFRSPIAQHPNVTSKLFGAANKAWDRDGWWSQWTKRA